MRILILNLFLLLSLPLHALTEGYGYSAKELFFICCRQGDMHKMVWVIKQYKSDPFSLSHEETAHACEDVITGGFDALLLELRHIVDFSLLQGELGTKWIDSALDIGYPNTVRLLQNYGYRLTTSQEKTLAMLSAALRIEPAVQAPRGINTMHFQAHGGEENMLLYEREYRLAVAYALYRLRDPECNFRRLIDNLGHRRRHMAGLGKVNGMQYYGTPTNQYMYTYYSPVYEEYGQRLHEKYPQIPKTVMAQLHGKEIALTVINDAHWQHPKGENREETLDHIAHLCQKIHKTSYAEKATLAYDLGKIIWWLAHAPPFLRGTPTLIAILCDAFWLYHNQAPPTKVLDLTCEALLYDNEEEFALYMNLCTESKR